MARRIGVFGGAFDPPHMAHVALARAALAQLQLDVLHVFPTGQAWHKARTLSPAEHRLAMARLAFEDCPKVLVDERELRRAGPTYTIDTLDALQAEYPDAQLYLLLGSDQATALPRWHRWEEILRIAIISVALRGDSANHPGSFDPLHPAPALSGGRFLPLQVPAMPHSATDIRARVRAGFGVDHLVPAGVARYIDQHHLYLSA